MAIPGIPTNVYLQQGNSQVFLSWDIIAGAVSYLINRSTDGVNFSGYAVSVVNNYLDTAVNVGTQYWYQVASQGTLSGTSSYSSPEKIIPAVSGKVPLGQVRLMAKLRADMIGSEYITLPEWNMFINQAYYELYDIVVRAYEGNYITAPYSFSTDGTALFTLPTDFYKLCGVDLGLGGNGWLTLKQFNFIDRNSYVYPQITSSALGVFNPAYRLVGDSLMFIPTPQSGQSMRIWYVPKLTMLLKDTDMLDGFNGWSQYVIIRAAKYALDKQEFPTGPLDAELAYLKERIESTVTNRDEGETSTVSNTRNSFYSGWDDYSGGNGSYGGF